MSNKYIELYNKALRLAITSHANQVDKTGILYITHPIRVADACDGWVDKIVALLHDVVEDTDCTFDILRAIFPEEIIMAVDAITRRDGESEPLPQLGGAHRVRVRRPARRRGDGMGRSVRQGTERTCLQDQVVRG